MGDSLPPGGPQSHQVSNESPPGLFSGFQSPESERILSPESQYIPEGQSDMNQQLPQMYGIPQHAFAGQMDMAQFQGQVRMPPFNMGAMINSLPQMGYRQQQPAQHQLQQQQQQQQQRYQPAVSSPGPSAGLHMGQYPVQQQFQAMPNQPYYAPHQPQLPQYYGAAIPSTQQQQTSPSPLGSLGMYTNTLVMNDQQPAQAPSFYYPPQYMPSNQAVANRILLQRYMASGPSPADSRQSHAQLPQDSHTGATPSFRTQQSMAHTGRSSVVRGPPRKPRQSGHAIWIGNLPPQTELMSLVHHVCKEAPGLDSLFLISKSNCAFANYKDEQTCAAAQQKLHDSKFQSVRLVSRLRKSAVENAAGVSAPTGPAASTLRTAVTDAASLPAASTTEDKTTPVAPQQQAGGEAPQLPADVSQQKDKFYILKSLTVDDLELSVRTGIWATQSHNEVSLNKAFEMADNVYLIFSANKSGEYFGYARMVSSIDEDPAAAIEFAPKAQATSDMDLPKAIVTEATEFTPRGRIIDDSARGTIFWEVEIDEATAVATANTTVAETSGDASGQDDSSQPGTSGTGSADDSSSARSGGTEGEESKAWGKPFKLEWLSVTRLPFYRTRGLRNPWNSNREVKIARDGTELEPSVGRKLIGLFNRVHQDSAAGPALAGIALGGGVPRPPHEAVGMVHGYPMAMRPPFQR